MEMPLKVIVVLILCLIVAATGIIFGMGVIGSGKEDADYFWDVEQCILKGNRCTLLLGGIDECCDGLVCRKPSPDDRYRECLEPGTLGTNCERDIECDNDLECKFDEEEGFNTCQNE